MKSLNSNKKKKYVVFGKKITIDKIDDITVVNSDEPLDEKDIKKIDDMLDKKIW
jgi:hypothetical protein